MVVTTHQYPCPQSSPFLSGARDDDFQCVDVDITDDSALEGDEVFEVELTTAEVYVMLGNNMAAVSVWDEHVSSDLCCWVC